MRLLDYLEARGELPSEFARRSGVPESTLRDILADKPGNMRTSKRIVRAAKRAPTPDGGVVDFQDLPPWE